MFLFVYGSLKIGFKYSYLINKDKLIGNAKTVEKYALRRYPEADYPYLTKEPLFNIEGQLFEIDHKDLVSLDKLEGYPEFYNREEVEIISENIKYKAIVYFISEEPKNLERAKNKWEIKDQERLI